MRAIFGDCRGGKVDRMLFRMVRNLIILSLFLLGGCVAHPSVQQRRLSGCWIEGIALSYFRTDDGKEAYLVKTTERIPAAVQEFLHRQPARDGAYGELGWAKGVHLDALGHVEIGEYADGSSFERHEYLVVDKVISMGPCPDTEQIRKLRPKLKTVDLITERGR